MEYMITFDEDPSQADIMTLWKGICEHAKVTMGHESGRPFAFFIKEEMGNIKGGCSGYLFHGCSYTDFLWVDNSLRGQGYGMELMERVEKLAIENDCRFMAVHTMDFEAPGNCIR